MCFAVNQANKKVIDDQLEFWTKRQLAILGWAPKRWMDGFTHPTMPVILQNGNVEPMQWGLIPEKGPYVKKPDLKKLPPEVAAAYDHEAAVQKEAKVLMRMCLNARCETIFELSSFRNAAPAQRGVLPVNGFFEYQHLDKAGNLDPDGKVTKAFRLSTEGKEIMYLATLYDVWRDQPRFTIITMDANSLMTNIHNAKKRMPVCIPESQIDDWLKPSDEEHVQHFFQPRDDLGLVAEPTEGKPKKGEEEQGGLF